MDEFISMVPYHSIYSDAAKSTIIIFMFTIVYVIAQGLTLIICHENEVLKNRIDGMVHMLIKLAILGLVAVVCSAVSAWHGDTDRDNHRAKLVEVQLTEWKIVKISNGKEVYVTIEELAPTKRQYRDVYLGHGCNMTNEMNSVYTLKTGLYQNWDGEKTIVVPNIAQSINGGKTCRQ